MATKGRLKELAQADIDRECKEFKKRSGNLIIRQATEEELVKYRRMVRQPRKEKMGGELQYESVFINE